MNSEQLGLVSDAIAAIELRWAPSEAAPALLYFLDYLTLSIDDSVDLLAGHPDFAVSVYNYNLSEHLLPTPDLATHAEHKRTRHTPFFSITVKSNRWTRRGISEADRRLQALLPKDEKLLAFLRDGLAQLQGPFKAASALRLRTSTDFRPAVENWIDILLPAHERLSQIGITHSFITRFPTGTNSEWTLCQSSTVGTTLSFDCLEDPDTLSLAIRGFTTGLVQHAGNTYPDRRLLVPIHYGGVPWAIVILDFPNSDAAWISPFHLYREPALFTSIRSSITSAKGRLLTELRDARKTLAASQRPTAASRQKTADLRAFLDQLFPDPDGHGRFYQSGMVLPATDDPYALWARHEYSALSSLHSRSPSQSGRLEPPYGLFWNHDENNPVVTICSVKGSPTSGKAKEVPHPQDTRFLLRLLWEKQYPQNKGIVTKVDIEKGCQDDGRPKAREAHQIAQAVQRNLGSIVDHKRLFKSARQIGYQLLDEVMTPKGTVQSVGGTVQDINAVRDSTDSAREELERMLSPQLARGALNRPNKAKGRRST